MSTVKLIYCRSRTIGGILIRLGQWWDQWNHCAIVGETGKTVLHARAFKGVVEEPIDEFLARYTKYDVVDCEIPDKKAFYEFARAQLGKKYDYGSIVTFITNKIGIKESPNRLQCAEYVELCRIKGGRSVFRVSPSTITPSQSYKVK